jgi:hypothetical protein
MSILSDSIQVPVPPAQLFTHIATLWEGGCGFGGGRTTGAAAHATRIGCGFRLQCGGHEWGAPTETELEIEDYDEPGGWRALSRPRAVLSWTVRIAPHTSGAELTCVLRHAPHGLKARLKERLSGRHLRRQALRRLLRAWKASVERQEALRRLRVALEAPGADPPKCGA